ncbi:hypothetical protein HQN60_01450 [Deefgea piscis]|uniref:Uncharacterized protein n=1 Tax=Deefgea piscis TaxID=2739061 RepID=A0A6M8SQD3_9NEIS|nr:hypothetical protein [Deefgea piscis]QKJ65506.1 hypothetical protein HQN60_01450 [Deefgea piscis]
MNIPRPTAIDAAIATPPFQDARSARDWLKLLPLINVPVAHAEIRSAIMALNHSQIAALDRLKIIEQFRETIHVLQDGFLNRYTQKALPLTEIEHQSWQEALTLWQDLEHSYASIWQAAIAGQSDVTEYMTLLAERTLYYSLQVNICYILVHRVIPAAQWAQQFSHYTQAQRLGVAQQKAKDSLITIGGVTTPENIFIHSLLLSAANPFQYNLRNLMWISACLEVFSSRCALEHIAETLPNRPAFTIDFEHPAAPERRDRPSKDSEMAISTLQLAQALSKRIKLLRRGEMPEKIGLGTTLSLLAAETLLTDLYRQWCEHPVERCLPRRASQKTAQIGFGLSNLHQWMAIGRFTPPPQAETQISSEELMQIRLFGQTSASSQSAPVIRTQPWQVIDETATGLRLEAPAGDERIALQQLLIIQDQQQYLMGQIRWISEQDQQLTIGVQLLPGVPQAASIRAQDAARFGQTDYMSVLLVPALVALKVPNSLLLPTGWFRQGRLLELWDGYRKTRIRLVSILSRGADFERVHFVASGTMD